MIQKKLDWKETNTAKEVAAMKKSQQSELYNQQIQAQKELEITSKQHKLEVQHKSLKNYKEIRNASKM
eukprot:5501119-Ditylum_brightwellii.AAC.1